MATPPSDPGASPEPLALWHTLPVSEVAARLEGDVTGGLTQEEAARRLAEHGPNTLAKARQRSTIAILVDQFRSLIVALLAAATGIAFALGDHIEAIAILVVMALNAAIGFFTEWRAGQALSALQKQAVPVAVVLRDGIQREIPAADLVPGDLVVLTVGARVPADGRVVESAQLQVEEAALTGESSAVTKVTEPIADGEAVLGDRLNMAFLGTTVTEGRAGLLVTATAAQTEVGRSRSPRFPKDFPRLRR
jgi:Ca2+-transporting ATPase